MAFNFKVKNTFLELDSDTTQTACESNAQKRSSSVPRVFKPGSCIDENVEICSPLSDDSTNASDKDIPESCPTFCGDSDYQDIESNCDDSSPTWTCGASSHSGSNICEECFSDHETVHSGSSDDVSSGSGKVRLQLADMVSTEKRGEKISLEGLCVSRSKLRSGAKLFRSAREPPDEVNALISSAVDCFRSCQDIIDVQVQMGGMGGTTMIVAQSCSAMPDASLTFPLVKDAALTAAAQSEKTYVMGYNVRPFNNLDSLSFSMNVACVPDAHQNTACWETYENGVCPRCSSCRWDHPAELDMMRIIVVLKKMQW